MPILLECPNGHRLRVADGMEGRRVRCPTCMQIVTVPHAMTEAPQEEVVYQPPEETPEPDQEENDDRDRPRRRKGKRKRRAARRARRLGLKIVGWGLLLNALSVIAAITAAALIIGAGIALIAVALLAKGEEGDGDVGAPASAGIAAIAAFAGVGLAVIAPLLGGVGKILCCWVPSEAQGRGLVITSIVCDAAQFIVPFIAVVVGVSGEFIADGELAWGAMIMQLILNGLAIGLWLASLLMFLMFLCRVSEFVGEEGYAEDARNLMKWAVFIGTTPFAMVVLSIIPFCGGCISLLLAIALLVIAVLFIISYLRLLFGLRYSVS